jgi:hypothetical protein
MEQLKYTIGTEPIIVQKSKMSIVFLKVLAKENYVDSERAVT